VPGIIIFMNIESARHSFRSFLPGY